jgi:AsmA protein
MKIMTRLLLGFISLVVILVVAGGVLLGFFVDPNDYRDRIERAALEGAGIELDIQGDIGWSLFPNLGLELGRIDARYPGQPQLASLEEARLSVQVMPLLSGNLQMSAIVIDGLKLNLITTGRANNWSMASETADTNSADESETPSRAGQAPLQGFDIESVTLSNAQVRYLDEAANTRLEINALNLTTGRLAPDIPIPLTIEGQVRQLSGSDVTAQGQVNLATDALLDLRTQRYQLNSLEGTVVLLDVPAAGKSLTLNLAANIDTDIDDQRINLGLQRLAVANLEAQGQVSVDNFQSPTIKGEIRVADFDLKQLMEELGQPAPQTRDGKALQRIGLGAALGGPAGTLTLDPLTLHIDDTQLNGSVVVDLKTMTPSISLQGETFDADRYLPPESTETASTETASDQKDAAERWSKEEIIPVEALKALNLNTTLDLKQLLVSGMQINNLGVTLSANNGLIKLSRLQANLYSGKLNNSATLDVRQSPPRLLISENLDGIQIGELLTDLAGEAQMTGTFGSRAELSASGSSLHAIVNSLTGNLSFSARDGVIKGIDMAQTVCQGINNVASLGINSTQVDRSTPFATMGGTFPIKNGVVNNQDLSASLDAMKLTGRGQVDLPQALIDYRLGLTITSNLFNETCSINNRLEGIEFPVNCKGSFDTAPAQLCRPDASVFTNLLKAEAKRKAQEKVESKIQEKLGDKLGDEGAKSLIKGLFGN